MSNEDQRFQNEELPQLSEAWEGGWQCLDGHWAAYTREYGVCTSQCEGVDRLCGQIVHGSDGIGVGSDCPHLTVEEAVRRVESHELENTPSS